MTAAYLPSALPAAPVRSAEAWLLALAITLFATMLFLVAFEQGTLTAGAPLLHEAFHDGRHLLGIPCH